MADDGSYGYYTGETITTPYGHYTIGGSGGLMLVAGGKVAGDVETISYFDADTAGTYPTLFGGHGLPSGKGGLLSESDAVLDSTGVYRSFGFGGQYEASLSLTRTARITKERSPVTG